MQNIKKSVFETLNAINVNGHTQQKDTGRVRLTYLSWAWAWAEVKKAYPLAFYTIYENANGWNYFTDGRTCWVKTGVTIEDLQHIQYLPVMDNKNQSILAQRVTSFDVNKAIQRSLTKAAARHGLGLYIYAGEDLPQSVSPDDTQQLNKLQSVAMPQRSAKPSPAVITSSSSFADPIQVDCIANESMPQDKAGAFKWLKKRFGVDNQTLQKLRIGLIAANSIKDHTFGDMSDSDMIDFCNAAVKQYGKAADECKAN